MSKNNIKKNNNINNNNKITRRYKEYVEPRYDDIKAWARDGVPEKEMAKRLGIAYSTFRDYKDHNSVLSALLKKSKEHFDNEVIDALHRNTLGGIIELTVPMKIKKTYFNELGKKEREEEEIVYVKTQEYVKPDTMAQIYWLNNRQSAKWKQKPNDDGEKAQSETEALNQLCDAIREVSKK